MNNRCISKRKTTTIHSNSHFQIAFLPPTACGEHIIFFFFGKCAFEYSTHFLLLLIANDDDTDGDALWRK